ncbi:hypothetical protein OHA25_03240 [Nonomuraea sp. NBC_00507]|uniref:hypothetical protein n=1 Tax=Nonomuraea sp. NBC_00507 TaxID=2976002 RepID=UPI002E18929C
MPAARSCSARAAKVEAGAEPFVFVYHEGDRDACRAELAGRGDGRLPTSAAYRPHSSAVSSRAAVLDPAGVSHPSAGRVP